MSRYTALLFDFGGTLADIHPHHEWLYVRACREFGIDLDPARAGITDSFGWEAYETPQGPVHLEMSRSEVAFREHKTAVLVDRLQRMGVREDPPTMTGIAHRIYELDTSPDMYRVYDEVVPVLDALRERGYRMAVISNHEWGLQELVAGLGLGRYFETVVSSARAGYRKPHPAIFRQTLQAMGSRLEDALMIGDGVSSDIAGARRLGMDAVLLDRRGTTGPVTGVPTLERLSGLLEILVE